jgi:hypothetical protein
MLMFRAVSEPLLGRRRFDDIENYSNDRSIYLAQLRDRIEEPWQAWELSHMPVAEYKQLSPAQVHDRLMPELTTGQPLHHWPGHSAPAIVWCDCRPGW